MMGPYNTDFVIHVNRMKCKKKKKKKRDEFWEQRFLFIILFISILFLRLVFVASFYWLCVFLRILYTNEKERGGEKKDWHHESKNKWITKGEEKRRVGTFYFVCVAAFAELLKSVCQAGRGNPQTLRESEPSAAYKRKDKVKNKNKTQQK
jgi:hypothetical protein